MAFGAAAVVYGVFVTFSEEVFRERQGGVVASFFASVSIPGRVVASVEVETVDSVGGCFAVVSFLIPDAVAERF